MAQTDAAEMRAVRTCLLISTLVGALGGCVARQSPATTEVISLKGLVPSEKIHAGACIVLTLTQEWHRFRDPEQGPFDRLSFHHIHIFDPSRRWQIELPQFTAVEGLFPFMLRQSVPGYLIFVPGANPIVSTVFYEYQVHSWHTKNWGETTLTPATPGSVDIERLGFVLGLGDLWKELQRRVAAGNDLQAIRIVGSSIALLDDATKAGDPSHKWDAQRQAVVDWCRKVSAN